MGTWGNGNFENDGALDLISCVITQDGLAPIEGAFDAILAVDGYIDVDYGEEAIAAAEIVAMLHGKSSSSIPEILSNWHDTHKLSVDDALINKAILAVKKATENPGSEFRELREEGQGLPEWYTNIQDLLDRLD